MLPRVPAVTHTVFPVVPLLTGDIPEVPLTPLHSPALSTALIYYLSAHSVSAGVVALLVSVLTTWGEALVLIVSAIVGINTAITIISRTISADLQLII